MTLLLSKRSSLIVQSEIRAMTIECVRIGGINLAQGVCDTEVPLPVRQGVQKWMEARSSTRGSLSILRILRYGMTCLFFCALLFCERGWRVGGGMQEAGKRSNV